MKVLLALIMATASIAACNEKDVLPAAESAVTGFWGRSGSDGRFLVLTNDGKVQQKKWDTIVPGTYYRYEVLTDSTMKFFKVIGQSVVAKYSLSQNNNILQLSGACIYDCEETFGRVLPFD